MEPILRAAGNGKSVNAGRLVEIVLRSIGEVVQNTIDPPARTLPTFHVPPHIRRDVVVAVDLTVPESNP
jgi:hypothetical protein